MVGTLRDYIVSGKVVCIGKTINIKRAKVKNAYTDLHAKIKFEEACKKKYAEFVRCEISRCYPSNILGFDIGELFDSLK